MHNRKHYVVYTPNYFDSNRKVIGKNYTVYSRGQAKKLAMRLGVGAAIMTVFQRHEAPRTRWVHYSSKPYLLVWGQRGWELE